MQKGTLAVCIAILGFIIGGMFLMRGRGERNLVPLLEMDTEEIQEISKQTITMETLKISTTAFEANGVIPKMYTCDGGGSRPDFVFTGIPTETVSLTFVMDDPDIPDSVKKSRGVESFVHWIVFNMPPGTSGIAATGTVPGIEGMNSAGKNSYVGACPPDREHRYFFLLYALNTTLELGPGATKADVEKAMEGHIVGQATLIGRYDRNPGVSQ